jgi:hypothetical protein
MLPAPPRPVANMPELDDLQELFENVEQLRSDDDAAEDTSVCAGGGSTKR